MVYPSLIMKIGPHDTEKRALIIAEIGNNHEGDLKLAEKMIALAAKAGADAVKFQTLRPESLVSPRDSRRFNQLKKFEFTKEQFVHLKKVADRENVIFLSTPFDLESVDFLNEIVPAFKIASGDNTFFPLLEKVAETRKPAILSTGMTTLKDVEKAAKVFRKGALAILHCVSSYPVPPEEANLRAIHTLQDHFFDFPIGYSDHTIGIDAAPFAVALGAKIIEKHFTLDKKYSSFRDHQLSADPDDLKEMIRRIRALESMLGTGEKIPQKSELEGALAARRSIAAARSLPVGHAIQMSDLTWLRPGGNLTPGSESKIIGKKLKHPVEQGDPFTTKDFQ